MISCAYGMFLRICMFDRAGSIVAPFTTIVWLLIVLR